MLRSCMFFSDLNDQQIAAASQLATRIKLRKNEMLMEEGSTPNIVYLILKGNASSYISNAQGKRYVLSFNHPGDLVGELSFIDHGPNPWHVAAEEDCELLAFRRQDLAQIFNSSDGLPSETVQKKLMMKLASMVRHLLTATRHLALLDVYGRIRILFNNLQVEENGHIQLKQQLTQQDIADRIGSSREMVARILKELVYGNYIRMENRRIVLMKMLPESF